MPHTRPPTGHRPTPRGRSPYADVVPWTVAALGHAAAAGTWAAAGTALPGGRWMAVHLFTLGVLTNLVLGFTGHFAVTLTRRRQPVRRWRPLMANVGAVLVMAGLPSGRTVLLGIGASVLMVVVFRAYLDLRRARREAVGARFGWIVRIYERAHGAFVHGALLGAAMGLGLLPGTWYAAARMAHLHVNVLGWGGLTLLATLVFFGPTMARTRIVPGADDRAAVALRHGATALAVGTVLLLVTGIGGPWGAGMRMGAATALAGYALAATTVCVPVVRAASRARSSAARWSVVAIGLWLPAAAWADVVLVGVGAWGHLDLLGGVVLVGVLLQSVLATLTYVAPMLRGRTSAGRALLMARLERLARSRAVAFNLGVASVLVGGLLPGSEGAVLGRIGWAMVLATAVTAALSGLLPVTGTGGDGTTGHLMSSEA